MLDKKVSLELAALLVIINFQEPCNHYYCEDDDEVYEFNYYEGDYSGWSKGLPTENLPNDFRFLAPTQSLVIQWLEETFSVYIEIAVDKTTYPKFAYQITEYDEGGQFDSYWENLLKPRLYSDLYKKKEECIEEALLFTLKLLLSDEPTYNTQISNLSKEAGV